MEAFDDPIVFALRVRGALFFVDMRAAHACFVQPSLLLHIANARAFYNGGAKALARSENSTRNPADLRTIEGRVA